MTNTVAPEVTRTRIMIQLDQCRNSIEDLRIQNIVAQSLGDNEEQRKLIHAQMERCVKAVEKLESMLAALNAEQAKDVTPNG